MPITEIKSRVMIPNTEEMDLASIMASDLFGFFLLIDGPAEYGTIYFRQARRRTVLAPISHPEKKIYLNPLTIFKHIEDLRITSVCKKGEKNDVVVEMKDYK